MVEGSQQQQQQQMGMHPHHHHAAHMSLDMSGAPMLDPRLMYHQGLQNQNPMVDPAALAGGGYAPMPGPHRTSAPQAPMPMPQVRGLG